jgi:predicted nucleotidyltransferase
VQHEIARLERLGVVSVARRGRQKFYRANEQHPLFSDLKRIVYKTAALGDVLRGALAPIKGILAAFIYGSVAKGREQAGSDIDLMVIGQGDSDELHRVLREAEEILGREITVNVMSGEEWAQRKDSRDSFVAELLRSPKIFLAGDEHVLRRP